MRFGISATSSIFPKNFLTRFRPVNVCAIMSSRSIDPSGPELPPHRRKLEPSPRPHASDAFTTSARPVPRQRGDQDDSPEGRNPSRPSGQASLAVLLHPTVGDPIDTRTAAMLCRTLQPAGRRPSHHALVDSRGTAPLVRGFPNFHLVMAGLDPAIRDLNSWDPRASLRSPGGLA